jgi:endonuclease/exonuclease/phosphatase family metal-dependent hydrolase
MPKHTNMDAGGHTELLATSQKAGSDRKQVIRAMTYNIHNCVDLNRNVNPELITGIIRELHADIVALQEVDAQMPLRPRQNQAEMLADKLRMNCAFFPVENFGLHAFGLAILSRFSVQASHQRFLPNLYPWLKPRKRGAVRASIQTPAGRIHVINTHLSLFKLERQKQLKTLLGKDWLSAPPKDEPVIFCGDLNAGPLSKTYRSLCRHLNDVQTNLKHPGSSVSQSTFHAKSPLFRIDHIFVSHHFQTLNVEVWKTAATQTASDHLPLVADLAI